MIKHVLIGFCLSFWGLFALAEDLGFRYDASLFICVDEETGRKGYNPSYRGECGEHRGRVYRGAFFESLDLSGSDFSMSVLSEASFYQSDLTSVNFSKAHLKSTNFSHARLVRANLRQVSASQVILYWSYLQGADLRGADLSFADLRGATLDLAFIDRNTKFKYAIFDEDTTLPFSLQTAEELGMRYLSGRDNPRRIK